MSSKVSPAETQENIDVLLLEIESGLCLHGDGITTMQFFDGDQHSAELFLKQRLAEVIAVNPWMVGTLVRDKNLHGKLAALRYSKEGPPQLDTYFEVSDSLQIAEDMPYEQLAKIVAKSSAHIPAGTKLLNKPLPVSRLTIAPRSKGSDGFVVIFSMSHVIGNGYVYFALLNMLSAKSDVIALNAKRKQELSNKGPDLVGKREYDSHLSGPTILNGIGAFMGMKCCGKKPKLFCYLVDDDKLNAAVAEAKSIPGAPEKISMNDILTSGYGQLVRPRLLTMAIDYHGKIEGLAEEDAGNYHSGLIYDPNGYATPAAIRDSLTGSMPLSRAALPCCCARMCCKMATITNWASVMKDDFCIPNCTQTLIIPYVDASMVPVDVAIVFKAGPGKTGMMLFAKKVREKEILAKLPLGDAVSPTMFPDS
eukprot:TRINITY_DN74709_c0_g1_i1.p1 TRINITY_DN74709_c0_g1~~TRINITY_DN74709_c0_g1_i1.p1  ORF type:complete len:422 (+),score=70.22 TRINITY_DN74709_c0_g1_i1:115-1380(+)